MCITLWRDKPLEKLVVARTDDLTVPEGMKGRQVLPNTFFPQTPRVTDRLGAIAYM